MTTDGKAEREELALLLLDRWQKRDFYTSWHAGEDATAIWEWMTTLKAKP